jgi:hypothetical protein
MTGYRLSHRGSITRRGRNYSPCHVIQAASGPHLFSGYRRQCGRIMKLFTHLYLVPRLRMRLHLMASLKNTSKITFHLYFLVIQYKVRKVYSLE